MTEVPPSLQQTEPHLLAAFALALSIVLALILAALWMRTNRMARRYQALLGGEVPENLEEMLLALGMRLEETEKRLQEQRLSLEQLAEQLPAVIRHVGLVRYQAFPETGSDLSFSLALLDAGANGVVISSLYGRSESRVYGKPVQEGRSSYPLSEEEQEAIARALTRRP